MKFITFQMLQIVMKGNHPFKFSLPTKGYFISSTGNGVELEPASSMSSLKLHSGKIFIASIDSSTSRVVGHKLSVGSDGQQVRNYVF